MTGKVPSSRSRKEKSRNSRPYDRANQSIFGKVASTVKGLFTPTWLFNVSSWVGANSQEGDAQASPEDTAEADLTENEDELEVQPPRPRLSGRAKRPRLETQDITSTPEIPFWLGPSTSHDHLSQETEKTECDSVRKEAPVIVNGDDHSENSDGSASTSGCSSLVSSHDKPHRSSGLKLSDSALELLQTELKNKPTFQRQRKEAGTLTSDMLETTHNVSCGSGSLWSCRAQSTTLKSPQVPSLINCSRPSFNVSSFGGPAKSPAASNKVSSPFYDGNTTFGGASAYRRRRTSHAPYEINPNRSVRQEMKVREAASSKDCISSAARRILQTLETMSTPISDAKKIPSVCRSPMDIPLTISPPSHRMKLVLSTSRSSPGVTLRGPPIVNLNAVSKLNVLKNHRSKMRNSMMELPLREQPMVSLPEECSVSKPQETRETTQRISNSSGGGKMKTKLRESYHAPSKAKNVKQPAPEYELPSVALPITSNMPVFKLHSTTSEKTKQIGEEITTSETANSKQCSLDNNTEPAFTFASPIEYVPPKPSFQAPKISVESSFKFSSPLIITSASSSKGSDDKGKNAEIYTNRSVDEIFKKVSEKPAKERKEKTASTIASTFSSKTSSSTASGFGFNIQVQPGSWECITCLVRNQATSLKCVACETPKPDSSSNVKSNSGFGDKFKPQEGSWECSACMVRNDSRNDKCVACETPKTSPLSSKAATSVVTEKESKKEVPSNTNSNKLFQSTAGTWECDTCLVRNSLDKNKCIACETLRPSKVKAGSVASTPFKFEANLSSGKESSGFNFASLVSSSTTTPATTFKFGASSDSDKQKSSTPSFAFGGSTVSPASIFGDSAAKNNDSAKESSAEPKTKETFKFGVTLPRAFTKENSNHNSKTASSEEKCELKVSNPIVPTSASSITTASTEGGGGFAFAKPLSVEKPAAASEVIQFTADFFKKPSDDSSTDTSSGFKFPLTSIGSSSASTVKFGASSLPKMSSAVSEAPAAEVTKPLSFTVASTAPSLNVGTTVTSQSDALHSKLLSQKTDSPVQSKAETTAQPIITTFASSAPMFAFGTVTSTATTSVVTTTTSFSTPTTASVFGVFGNNSSQAEQKQLKGLGTEVKSTASSLVPQAIPGAASSSAGAPFAFQTGNVFSSMPVTGGTESKTTISQDQTPRTQANPTAFSFGIAPSTTVFSFGSSNAASSSGFTCTTTVAAVSTQVTKTVDAAQTSQPSNIFTFGASSKMAESKQPVAAATPFKNMKEDAKSIFPQPSQPQFGSFKSEPMNNSSGTGMFKFGVAAPSSSAPFVFGATTKSDTATTPAPFAFGTAPPKAPTFGGFQPTQQPVSTSSMGFNFGSSISTVSTASAFNPSGSNAFAFSAKNNQASSMNTQPVAPSAPAVAFGSSNVQPVFGGNATPAFGGAAAPATAFGNTSTPTFGSVSAPKPESSGGFNFNPHQQRSANLFQFGAPAEKKPQTTPSQGSGFPFGMTSPVEPQANTSFTPSFMVSPPSFNFGGTSTSTPTQPFQFAANSDVSTPSSSAPQRKIRRAVRRGIRKPD